MSVLFHTSGLTLTADQRASAQHRLQAALSRFGRRVTRIRVYVADVNGQRGGVDKTCRVVAHVRRQPSLVIEGQHSDLAALIEEAAERLEQAASRQLDRARDARDTLSFAGSPID